MKYNSLFKNTLLFVGTSLFSIGIWDGNANNIKQINNLDFIANLNQQEIKTGADNYQQYLPILKEKKVGILTNQSGLVNENSTKIHLLWQICKEHDDN